ncbi:hypothetical protein H9P43_007929 [Blastocladiella emersonii ATCC 22665]|nr:hypothetical protein H9P43_007929 [Blastocladiella emersonii ATCC 22665]
MASCVLLGHTGAVGKALLREVMSDPRIAKVATIDRREITCDGPNKEKLYAKLEDYRAVFKGYDGAFCSLGTTRAEVGSAEAFFRIDHDYVLNAAKLIKEEAGEKPVHFLYISSQMANLNSPFPFPKSKGQLESDLADLGFEKLTIAMVSLFHDPHAEQTRIFVNHEIHRIAKAFEDSNAH